MAKARIITSRTYYNYYHTAFSQPTLSSNGTLGVDSFAVSMRLYNPDGQSISVGDACYSAFYPNTGEINFYRDEAKRYVAVTAWFSTPVILSEFYFKNKSSGSASSNAYECKLFGGIAPYDTAILVADIGQVNVGKTSTTSISSSYTLNGYNYYTITMRNGGNAENDRLKIGDIKFSGVKVTTSQSSTATSYYEDKTYTYLHKPGSVYYAIN